jgi:hypothetical protein
MSTLTVESILRLQVTDLCSVLNLCTYVHDKIPKNTSAVHRCKYVRYGIFFQESILHTMVSYEHMYNASALKNYNAKSSLESLEETLLHL